MGDGIHEYLEAVRGTLASERSHVATILVGSLASGDFDPASSDLDLIVLFEAALSFSVKEELTAALRHEEMPCPARGLDLIAYARSEVRRPSADIHFEFSISSGRDWQDDVSFGGAYPGGLIDLAAARQFGTTLENFPVGSLIGPVDRDSLRFELARSLHWHIRKVHDPFHDPLGVNAVLNACRALHFVRSGLLVSKSRGAEVYLDGRESDLVRSAQTLRRGSPSSRLPKAAVVTFLEMALAEIDEDSS